MTLWYLRHQNVPIKRSFIFILWKIINEDRVDFRRVNYSWPFRWKVPVVYKIYSSLAYIQGELKSSWIDQESILQQKTDVCTCGQILCSRSDRKPLNKPLHYACIWTFLYLIWLNSVISLLMATPSGCLFVIKIVVCLNVLKDLIL